MITHVAFLLRSKLAPYFPLRGQLSCPLRQSPTNLNFCRSLHFAIRFSDTTTRFFSTETIKLLAATANPEE